MALVTMIVFHTKIETTNEKQFVTVNLTEISRLQD
jgi:hypothetical protein